MKALERSISDLEKAIGEDKEMVATLTSEIEALTQGITDLDKDVAEATEQRKKENEEYVAELAANSAAVELIKFAKNRMNKFYNPKLYKPPPKRELTEEERITLNMGGTLAPTNPPAGIAGTGVGFLQVASFSTYAKQQEASGGVIAMMDMMKKDVAKEVLEMELEEKDAQADYETMVTDAADKRAMDLVSIDQKTEQKAGLEDTIVKTTDTKSAKEAELMATKQYISELHADCDWLLENFDARKEARSGEIDALKKAKAVLSGADYSLVQMGHHVSRQ